MLWLAPILGLVGVVIGGGIAIAQGYYLENFKAKAQRENRRAQKFEELVEAVYAYDHWLDQERARAAIGRDIPELPDPISKVRAIATVYFPEFDDSLSELETRAASYKSWIYNVGHKRAKSVVDKTPLPSIDMDEFNAEYQPYRRQFRDVLEEMKNCAGTEFSEG